jgi:serine/threonine protein kinase
MPNDPYALAALRDVLPGVDLEATNGDVLRVVRLDSSAADAWTFMGVKIPSQGHKGEPVTLVFRPDAAVDARALARFEREQTALDTLAASAAPMSPLVQARGHGMATIASPHGGEPLSLPWMALERVEAPTLAALIAQNPKHGLPAARVRGLAGQIALGLTSLHQFDLLHGALAPRHIHVTTTNGSDRVKIARGGGHGLHHLQRRVRIPTRGKVMIEVGNDELAYAAPEMLAPGREDRPWVTGVSRQTDIFALGCSVFHMLTGSLPFGDDDGVMAHFERAARGGQPMAALRKQMSPEIRAAKEIIAGLDRELLRALAAAPSLRPTSVNETWIAIGKWLDDAADRPANAPPSSRRGPRVTLPPVDAAVAEAALVRGARSDPASWKWKVLVAPREERAVAAATFSPDGRSAVLIGPRGALRWDGGRFTEIALPTDVSAPALTGVRWLRGDDVAIVGHAGAAFRVSPSGRSQSFGLSDRATLYDVWVDDSSGITTFVGARVWKNPRPGRDTIGTWLQWSKGSVAYVADVLETPRLRRVAEIDGRLVACGDDGAVVVVPRGAGPRAIKICTADLTAITPWERGALVVGEGGWALAVSGDLAASPEAVQTTKGLTALFSSPTTQEVWAGSREARLLRRTDAGVWRRMTGNLALTSSVLALWSDGGHTRAICSDGAMLEGTFRPRGGMRLS